MHILYIANIRMPTEKAHGAQIMKTCEALARAGARVSLVVPNRKNPIRTDPFLYYKVDRNFEIVTLPVLDAIQFGRIGFWIESLSFSFFALFYALTHRGGILYSRDELPLWVLSLFFTDTVWESHTGRANCLTRRLLSAGRKGVVISHGLLNLYAQMGARAEMLVAPDAIDLEAFKNPEPAESAKRRLGLPLDKKIVLYIGRLDGWKGVSVLLEASKLLSSEFQTAIIGGEKDEVIKLSAGYAGVMFLGAKPYSELAGNEAAADVLVLPNTGRDIVSARYTSPMKLFSYMAAGKPIVASDLPSIREILDERSAKFFTPDNPQSLADAIISLGGNLEQASMLAQNAKIKAEKYTWARRAESILTFLQA